MAKRLEDKLRELPRARREKVRARTDQLIAEEKTLAELRRALDFTQKQLAEALDIGQDGISRLERRSDLLISTLGSYIDAMGGQLRLVAEFPDRPPVSLGGLADLDPDLAESERPHA